MADVPFFAISINAIWRLETWPGRSNCGDRKPEQKNNIAIQKYIPANIRTAYFGFCSAIIHEINAGTRVINTKFLRRSMSNKKITVTKMLFPEILLFLNIKNTWYNTMERPRKIRPSL